MLTLPRPYFYPIGAESAFDAANPATFQVGPPLANGSLPTPDMGSADLKPLNPHYAPVLTIPQDLLVLAPPATVNQANVDNYEASFPRLVLEGGLPASEQTIATATSQPFHFQLCLLYTSRCV